MQPARKLLSLLFLILMGTELTIRASNAIFLPACAGSRPARSRQSGSRPHSSAPPTPAPPGRAAD